jgi:general stress protein 26
MKSEFNCNHIIKDASFLDSIFYYIITRPNEYNMKKKLTQSKIFFFLLWLVILAPGALKAQNYFNRDTILAAASEIIQETVYCALVTIDSTGQPDIRTMNPFPPAGDWITWFATSRYSDKVKEIRNNPKVCVYYADHTTAKGYVNITGTAEVIDDQALLINKKRAYWDNIPGWQDNFVLIKIVPKSMEVINYKHSLNNDPRTFKAPGILF